MQPGRERRFVTAGLVLGIVVSAVEATAVSASMPTAAGELGGARLYSWIFSAYLLTSTTTVPLYGKLADLFGRLRVFQISILIFIVGSALCGLAGSMAQLILFRAIQGIGAGGISPITATLAADIYNLEERGRIQGVFAGTWAVSGLLGPLVGGWVTATFSWRWIFYLGIPFGLVSMALMQRFLRERFERQRRPLDILGTVSLTAAVSLLLIALAEGADNWGWSDPRTLAMLLGSVLCLALFLWQERRAPDPMLPLDLFRNRIIAVAAVGNSLVGMLLFGFLTYVPVFGQGALGGSPVDAGILLIPLSIGWTISSTVGGRFLLRTTYRILLVSGSLIAIGGAAWLLTCGPGTPTWRVMAAVGVVGLGMGFISLPYLLGVQNAVAWAQRGVATGTVQFFRSMGGAVAVAVLGVLFNARQRAAGGGGDEVSAVLDPATRATLDPALVDRLQSALLQGLDAVFWAFLLMTIACLVVAFAFPNGSPRLLAHPERS